MNPALPNFDQTLFGKTSLTVQRAMAGNNGLVVLDFPVSFVLSDSNPWDPHGFVDPAHGKIVLAAFNDYWEVVTNK